MKNFAFLARMSAVVVANRALDETLRGAIHDPAGEVSDTKELAIERALESYKRSADRALELSNNLFGPGNMHDDEKIAKMRHDCMNEIRKMMDWVFRESE